MNALLPSLHQSLVGVAARRNALRRQRIAVATVAALLLLSGGALAASGLFGRVDHGRAGRSTYTLTALQRDRQLCLQITWSGARPAIRCDPAPSAKRPFGAVLRAVSPDGGGQILAGLVRRDVPQVRVLGHGIPVATHTRPGVPGRVFLIKGRFPRVRVEAMSASGQVLGRLGTNRASSKPLSRAQGRREGDPAAFAPSAALPPFTFHGRGISDREATRRHLACSSDTGVCVTKAEFLRELRHRSRMPARGASRRNTTSIHSPNQLFGQPAK